MIRIITPIISLVLIVLTFLIPLNNGYSPTDNGYNIRYFLLYSNSYIHFYLLLKDQKTSVNKKLVHFSIIFVLTLLIINILEYLLKG